MLVGLGNPGLNYAKTRHNAGFMAIDRFCEIHNVKNFKSKFNALIADCNINGEKILIVKPQTYMNNSGEAVRDAAAFYKIPAERIIVISDDISLDVGKLRIKRKGSDGGHNGLKSIIYQLQSDNFARIKMGVGKKPHPEYDLADWVLGKIPASDREAMKTGAENAASAALLWVAGKTDAALSSYSK